VDTIPIFGALYAVPKEKAACPERVRLLQVVFTELEAIMTAVNVEVMTALRGEDLFTANERVTAARKRKAEALEAQRAHVEEHGC